MAVLSSADRAAVRTQIAQLLSADRIEISGVSKADLRAAVDATDDWINSNAGSFNSSLPITARSNLTASQKAMLVAYVTLKRYGG